MLHHDATCKHNHRYFRQSIGTTEAPAGRLGQTKFYSRRQACTTMSAQSFFIETMSTNYVCLSLFLLPFKRLFCCSVLALHAMAPALVSYTIRVNMRAALTIFTKLICARAYCMVNTWTTYRYIIILLYVHTYTRVARLYSHGEKELP